MEHIYIVTILFSVVFALIGVIYKTVTKDISNIQSIQKDHEKRIQSVEDIQGTKIDIVIKDIEELKNSFKDLTAMVHREKNQENALNVAIRLLIKQLEKNNP